MSFHCLKVHWNEKEMGKAVEWGLTGFVFSMLEMTDE